MYPVEFGSEAVRHTLDLSTAQKKRERTRQYDTDQGATDNIVVQLTLK